MIVLLQSASRHWENISCSGCTSAARAVFRFALAASDPLARFRLAAMRPTPYSAKDDGRHVLLLVLRAVQRRLSCGSFTTPSWMCQSQRTDLFTIFHTSIVRTKNARHGKIHGKTTPFLCCSAPHLKQMQEILVIYNIRGLYYPVAKGLFHKP